MQDLIESIIPNALLAIATAWLTVRFSLRSFYHERWWERRFDAYSRLIEALHRMKWTIEREFEAARNDRSLGHTAEKENQEIWAESTREISRATDLASFLLTSALETQLRTLTRELDRAETASGNYYEVLGQQSDAIQSCLDSVVSFANHHLKAKP